MSYASEGSETTAGGTKRRKRSTRSSSVYVLAHPAPTLTSQQKLLQIRPKLLFQLQRISPDKRPLPTIDVMPSTVVVPRLLKKFPRLFKGKAALGTNDVIIVKSEDYDSPDDTNDDTPHEEDSVGNRDVLAVICQTRGSSSNTEICLSDGSIWHATSHGKHNFEFETTDLATGETTKARWVQRIAPKRHESSNTNSGEDAPTDTPKFNFSLIDPNTRRHPILASLTKDRLDIPDTYTTCSSSAGRYPPTSPIRASGLEPAPPTDEDVPVERTTHALDEDIKVLIQMTSIWIALRMGWSSYFNYDDAFACVGKLVGTSGHRARSLSVDHTRSPVIDTRASTPESGQSFGSKGVKLFNPASIFHRSPSSTSAAVFDTAAPVPKRSVSTGTAFMQRAAARRAGHPPSTVASDSEEDAVPASPIRAATIDVTGKVSMKSKHMSTPSPLSLHEPIATAPDTPTKPHRRIQSAAYYPNSLLKTQVGVTGHSNAEPSYGTGAESDSLSSGYPTEVIEKKGGRLKQLIALFRRRR